jgi:hypothetical protein
MPAEEPVDWFRSSIWGVYEGSDDIDAEAEQEAAGDAGEETEEEAEEEVGIEAVDKPIRRPLRARQTEGKKTGPKPLIKAPSRRDLYYRAGSP